MVLRDQQITVARRLKITKLLPIMLLQEQQKRDAMQMLSKATGPHRIFPEQQGQCGAGEEVGLVKFHPIFWQQPTAENISEII